MANIAAKFFKYRSYTPIPFLLVMFFYEDANVWSLIIGFLTAFSGEMIRLWGVSWAGSETRTTGTVGGSYLIVSGPFAHVRNPLYVGNILLYLGMGIMSMALFPYLQIIALLFFFVQYSYIVSEEENYLRKTYGTEYQDFEKNVPRFFPRISKYKVENIEQPPFSLRAGLKSERRTLQAFCIVSITILLIWFF